MARRACSDAETDVAFSAGSLSDAACGGSAAGEQSDDTLSDAVIDAAEAVVAAVDALGADDSFGKSFSEWLRVLDEPVLDVDRGPRWRRHRRPHIAHFGPPTAEKLEGQHHAEDPPYKCKGRIDGLRLRYGCG